MDYEESKIQAGIVKEASLLGCYPVMIPNGECGAMSVQKAARLKATGFRSGMSDLIIYDPRLRYSFFLEIKKPGGKQSANQKDFEAFVLSRGREYHIADSVELGTEIIKTWLNTLDK